MYLPSRVFIDGVGELAAGLTGWLMVASLGPLNQFQAMKAANATKNKTAIRAKRPERIFTTPYAFLIS